MEHKRSHRLEGNGHTGKLSEWRSFVNPGGCLGRYHPWHALYARPKGWCVHVLEGKPVVSNKGIMRRWWAWSKWKASIWSTLEFVCIRHGGCWAEGTGNVPVQKCAGERWRSGKVPHSWNGGSWLNGLAWASRASVCPCGADFGIRCGYGAGYPWFGIDGACVAGGAHGTSSSARGCTIYL